MRFDVDKDMQVNRPIVRLITFGGGGVEYRQAAERLITQSNAFSSIDERKAYTDDDLSPSYYESFKGLIENFAVGYGLYSWKPYLIHKELSELRDNDILVYIDAGCELNKGGIRRFDDYLSYTSKNGVLLFELQHPNRFWTKDHPKLLGDTAHYFRNQLASGIIFLKNNLRTRQLVKQWLDLCAYENGVLLKDPEHTEAQLPGFMKHRHDQSCLSICAYQYDVAVLPDETWFQNWSDGQDFPILAFRNRTGRSVLEERLRKRFFKEVKSRLRRFKRT